MRKALIMGVDGQDGSYLAELLLLKDYQIIGWIPSTIPVSLKNIDNIRSKIEIVKGNIVDQDHLNKLIYTYKPDEIYNLASPSSPTASWDNPVLYGDIAALSVVRLLEAVKDFCPEAKFYQASTSEMFGDPLEVPQRETTPFNPRNPYGISKTFAHWAIGNYRNHYGLFAVSGIMYNHESPRRQPFFVTRKITLGAAKIKTGISNNLVLGNIHGMRDWGFSGDYVNAMWMMLQNSEPDDFVIGTGKTHSVKDILDIAFGYLNLDWENYVSVDNKLLREEKNILVADSTKAKKILGWESQVSFEELIIMMVDEDIKRLCQ